VKTFGNIYIRKNKEKHNNEEQYRIDHVHLMGDKLLHPPYKEYDKNDEPGKVNMDLFGRTQKHQVEISYSHGNSKDKTDRKQDQ
jgi:hypothetical protein